MLDEIFVLFGRAFAGRHADDPFAAPPLRAIGTDVRSFDQAVMRQSDNHSFIGDKVFNGNLALVRHDLG